MTRETLLNEYEAAGLLGISVYSLRRWRSERRGQGPSFLRLGRSIRYSTHDIEAFIEQSRVAPRPGGER